MCFCLLNYPDKVFCSYIWHAVKYRYWVHWSRNKISSLFRSLLVGPVGGFFSRTMYYNNALTIAICVDEPQGPVPIGWFPPLVHRHKAEIQGSLTKIPKPCTEQPGFCRGAVRTSKVQFYVTSKVGLNVHRDFHVLYIVHKTVVDSLWARQSRATRPVLINTRQHIYNST